MFALNDADLRSKILGCADGPASFNAEATRQGIQVLSADPLYGLDADTIRDRIKASYSQILVYGVPDKLIGVKQRLLHSADELGRMRMQAMQAFLDDYDRGRQQGRYVEAELPLLPFVDQSFDLALCSHFLFLYTHLSDVFHCRAVLELCRVAREVRIFPLLALDGHPSPHVAAVSNKLRDCCEVSIEIVPYEFQRGGNQMMRIRVPGIS